MLKGSIRLCTLNTEGISSYIYSYSYIYSFICTHSLHSSNTLMVTDFLFGFRTLTLSYADLTLSHCNIDLLFVNLVNLVNL